MSTKNRMPIRAGDHSGQASRLARAIPPVVGLGASAGGLEALTGFLEAMPSDSGLAFVVIHHADPDHESLMAEILGKHTRMRVTLAKDKEMIRPNHVYIIPPHYFLSLVKGTLRLTEPEARRGMRLPIDFFLRSLAADQHHRSIAIILSGTGSDGTQGIRSIKEQGGMVIAQSPEEAAHDSMPRSAMRTGVVDHVLAVDKMPPVLIDYGKHPYVSQDKPTTTFGHKALGTLSDIVSELRAHSPINFELYKEGTLLRRVERRMSLKHIESAADYLSLLRQDPNEASLLCNDLLISVTSFFRDPEAFEYLAESIFPDMIRHCKSDQSIRIWVPGCATGEEAYSLSMSLIEQISAQRKDIKLQVFASDVDEHALTIARAGIYPDSIEADVSAARLNRFFIKDDHTYHVTTELRESVIFASQNLLAEPPFSKLDLISCRNLLIYLNMEAQERVLAMFHFALKDGGLLFLGPAESVGSHDKMFKPVSTKHRVYERVGLSHSRSFDFPVSPRQIQHQPALSPETLKRDDGMRLAEISRAILIEKYAPAAVLINSRMQILYSEGPVDAYLKVPAGEPSQDILHMARDGLRVHLGIAIRKAIQDDESTNGVGNILQNHHRLQIRMTVHPVQADRDKLYLVTFTEHPEDETAQDNTRRPMDTSTHQLLEQELEFARRDLQITIRELELSNEELKAANEEAMSVNEEFQSTNEELETSKEELQSLNEELTTLNAQLQQKIEDSTRLADDLNNLLSSSGIATLFLDRDMNIKRYTPAVRKLFNVIATDIGRPFEDITSKIEDPTLLDDAKNVLLNLVPTTAETKSISGHWFNRSILPYQTQSGSIDGVVVTFSDITHLKSLQNEALAAQVFAENIIDTVRDPLLVLELNFAVVKVNLSFHLLFGTSDAAVVNRSFFDLVDRQWDIAELRTALQGIIPEVTTVESFEIHMTIGDLGERIVMLNARAVLNDQGTPDRILVSFRDVTDSLLARRALEDREARLSAILETAPEAIITCDEHRAIDSFSPAAEQLFGYKAEEVIGQKVDILLHEDNRNEQNGFLANYRKYGEKGTNGLGREIKGLSKNGLVIPLGLSVSEMMIGTDRLFIGVAHDLTEQKERHEQLIRAQKMETIGQLTGGIAHDFNNLLTVIIGSLEFLEGDYSKDELRESVVAAKSAAEMGAQLTSQLLSFGQRMPLQPHSVSLNKLIESLRSLLTLSLGEHIRIRIQLADDLKPVMADSSQIENALLNLALNARDAMPGGGTLTISTENIIVNGNRPASHSELAPGKYVMLSVKDTGIGMTPEVMERAFEPYFTTKSRGEGTGLGLSMIYGFAKQSGGLVALASEPGTGTTVSLFLPQSTEEKKEDIPRMSTMPPKANGESILVVEDDPAVRKLTIKRLHVLGYETLAASNGREAIRIIKENPQLRVVLTDAIMPGGMSGFDVVNQAMELNKSIKAMVVTGYTGESRDISGREKAHKCKVLRKPYRMDELAVALRDLLN